MANHQFRLRVFYRAPYTLPPETLGILKSYLHIRNSNINEQVAVIARTSADTASYSRSITRNIAIYKSIVTLLRDCLGDWYVRIELPLKQATKEFPEHIWIFTNDLKVNNRQAHIDLLHMK